MNWKHNFDIKEEWKNAEDRNISVNQFSKNLGTRIVQSPFYNREDNELMDIVDEFFSLGDATWDDFDVVWDQFYNWADRNSVWVRTF